MSRQLLSFFLPRLARPTRPTSSCQPPLLPSPLTPLPFQTLFNPNKTVVKMFLVTYDFHDMPANHVTFLRHRIFLVPVGEGEASASDLAEQPKRVLCYLIHLR